MSPRSSWSAPRPRRGLTPSGTPCPPARSARFGLKFTTVRELLNGLGDRGEYFYHEYARTPEEKLAEMRAVLERWRIRVP